MHLPAVLRIRIRDPMPVWPLDPGWVKKFGSYFWVLRNHCFGLKYLHLWGGSGIPDGKNSDPGSGINIPDPQHCLPDSRFPQIFAYVCLFSGIGLGLPAAEVLGPGNPHLSLRSLLHLCPAHLPQPGPSRCPQHTQGPQWAGGDGNAQWAK